MEYRREANSGNYVVVITCLFGAFGFIAGVAHIVGFGSAEASSAGDTLLLALTVGAVWGVIGLLFGAMVSAVINGGFWSIPIILVMVLVFQSIISKS